MKKTMRLFAVLCAVTLALLAACANDDDNESAGTTKYLVTFDSKGGDAVPAQAVENGKKVVEPKEPTKENVTFGGWYNGEEPFRFATPITDDIILTAKWISKQYKDKNGGVTVITIYDDGTFEYKDEYGTSRGTYEENGDKIQVSFTDGDKSGGSMEVDTSGDTPSVTEDGKDVGDFEQVENPENQNPQDSTDNNGGTGNNGEDESSNNSGNGGTDTVTYALGDIVTISDVKYLVVKNTEMSGVAPQKPALGYYPNSRADLYRDHLLEKYGVQRPYVIVFNTETAEKKIGSTSSSTYDDDYRILRDGETHYRIRYRWEENQMTDFANKTTNDLRQNYDPSCFMVENYVAAYGTDLSKKFTYRYRFEYGKDGKTIAYSDDNWREYDDLKDYMYIVETKKERNQYEIIDRISSKARSYTLRNPNNTDTDNGNNLFEFRVDFEDDGSTPRSYRLIAMGNGTIQYEPSDYKNTLRIYDLEYSTADSRKVRFTVDAGNGSVEFDDLYEREDDAKDDGAWSSPSDDKEPSSGGSTGNVSDKGDDSVTNTKVYAAYSTVVKNEGVGKYVKVSNTTTSVNGITVPTTITFTVPFENANAPLGKFTTVTFVPQSKDKSVIYVPEKGSKADYKFIDDYKDGYDIFGAYSATRPASSSSSKTDSSAVLQDDVSAKNDTTTPKRTFAGSSLKIELEDMNTNFRIINDTAASGGKSGILVDENSSAEAIITFPAGSYTGYVYLKAPNSDSDAFYVKFGDGHFRVYADDPPPAGYAKASRTPIELSCDRDVTVRMTITQHSEKFPNKPGETGMYIDYVEFTKK